jgi:hypothetical protein
VLSIKSIAKCQNRFQIGLFYSFQYVLYLDPVSKLTETTEKSGYFIGCADNKGDTLTFMVLKNDLTTVLHRSVVQSAADANY